MAEKRFIDMNSWARAEHYRHFTENGPCAISLADDIDVTALYAACKSAGQSFYIACLWTVSAVVNAHEEFRLTEADSPDSPLPLPAVWDEVHPVHNVFHPENETYTALFTLWSPEYSVFAERAAEDIARAKSLSCMSVPAPENVFEASCVPWRYFTSVGVETGDLSLSPVIAWGGFRLEGERVKMPLSISISHAAADGYHLARFLNEVEREGEMLARRIGGSL